MLELYDVVRDRVYWINIDQIVSLTAVNKDYPYEGTYVDINGHPIRVTVDKKPKEVLELIEKKRRLSK